MNAALFLLVRSARLCYDFHDFFVTHQARCADVIGGNFFSPRIAFWTRPQADGFKRLRNGFQEQQKYECVT
jgi:hypothetical protein